MERNKLYHLTLDHIHTVLEDLSEQDIHGYISDHVIAMKSVDSSIFLPFERQPMIVEEMRIFVLRRGHACPVINLLPVDVQVGDLVFLSKNSTVVLNDYSTDFEGEGFAVTDEIFRMALGNVVPTSMDGHIRNFKVSLRPEEYDLVSRFIAMLYDTLMQSDYSSRVFLSLTSAFCWYVDALYHARQNQLQPTMTREQQVFADFIALINEYARREHQLGFYADKLCLSLRYMGTIVKAVSGRSAKEWIDEALITAIKVDLRHSSKPLNQISDEMQFANTSFFSKYFRRMTGLSPLEYRRAGSAEHKTFDR